MFNKKELIKQIARERIEILFKQAGEMQNRNQELSKKYVRLIKRLSSHYKVGIPKEIKNNICRKCNLVLIPGSTASIKIVSSRGYIAKKCLSCGNEIHIFYKKQRIKTKI